MKTMSELELLLGIWGVVRDNITHSKRAAVARDILYVFEENGVEPPDIAAIVDEDPDLADAFEEVFPPVDNDEDYEED